MHCIPGYELNSTAQMTPSCEPLSSVVAYSSYSHWQYLNPTSLVVSAFTHQFNNQLRELCALHLQKPDIKINSVTSLLLRHLSKNRPSLSSACQLSCTRRGFSCGSSLRSSSGPWVSHKEYDPSDNMRISGRNFSISVSVEHKWRLSLETKTTDVVIINFRAYIF